MALWNRRASTTGNAGAPVETPETRSTTTETFDIQSPIGFASFKGQSADMSTLGAASFKKSGAYQRGENLIVDNVARLQLIVEGPDGKPVARHPLLDIWNKTPNSHQSAYAFHQARLRRKRRTGGAQIILDRGATGLGPVRSMTLVTGPIQMLIGAASSEFPYGELIGWKVQMSGTGQWLFYRPSEILNDHYPDPDDPFGQVSPITALLTDLGLIEKAKQWQANLLNSGAMPNVIIGMPGADAQTAAAASQHIQTSMSGATNAGRAVVLGQPMNEDGKAAPLSVTPLSFNTSQMGFLDTLSVAEKSLAQGMGIPVDLLTGQTTYENLDAAGTQLWSETLIGESESTASEIDRLLLPDVQLTCRFDLSKVDALKENETSVLTRWTAVYQANGITLNEFREKTGQEPLPDGDRLLHEILAATSLTNAQALAASGAVGSVTRDAVTITGVRIDPTPVVAPAAEIEARANTGIVTPAEKILRTYDDYEADVQDAAVRAFDAMATHVERNLKSQGKRYDAALAAGADEVRLDLAKLFNIEAMVQRVQDLLTPSLRSMVRSVARRTAKGLRIDLDQKTGHAVLEALDERVANSARSIVGTTSEELSVVLIRAVEDGLGTEEIAARIRGAFTDMTAARAATIARTEVVGGHNAAAREVAIQSGLPGLRRRWMATNDSRTRASHSRLDGHTTEGLYDPYPNGCMHPGDHNGPASETVNCRCVEEILTLDD